MKSTLFYHVPRPGAIPPGASFFLSPYFRKKRPPKQPLSKIIFSFSDGTKGELSIGENFTQISIKKSDDEESFFNEKNGRIYFSLNGDDITDTVEQHKYFRFEINRENGKSVLFIGGESGKYGWCELVFDKNGKYITNRRNIPVGADEGNPAWLNEAMHNEGVPCGEPELDSQLEKNSAE